MIVCKALTVSTLIISLLSLHLATLMRALGAVHEANLLTRLIGASVESVHT